MEGANLKNMQRICGGDPAGKMHRLLDYTDRPGDVADPWYTGDCLRGLQVPFGRDRKKRDLMAFQDGRQTMSEIKIHIFHIGKVCVAPELPFGGEHYSALKASGVLDRKSKRLWLPVSAYLPLYFTNQVVVESSAAIDEQLAARGVAPVDWDAVLLSHLDCDHANGLKLVADAKKILVL